MTAGLEICLQPASGSRTASVTCHGYAYRFYLEIKTPKLFF